MNSEYIKLNNEMIVNSNSKIEVYKDKEGIIEYLKNENELEILNNIYKHRAKEDLTETLFVRFGGRLLINISQFALSTFLSFLYLIKYNNNKLVYVGLMTVPFIIDNIALNLITNKKIKLMRDNVKRVNIKIQEKLDNKEKLEKSVEKIDGRVEKVDLKNQLEELKQELIENSKGNLSKKDLDDELFKLDSSKLYSEYVKSNYEIVTLSNGKLNEFDNNKTSEKKIELKNKQVLTDNLNKNYKAELSYQKYKYDNLKHLFRKTSYVLLGLTFIAIPLQYKYKVFNNSITLHIINGALLFDLIARNKIIKIFENKKINKINNYITYFENKEKEYENEYEKMKHYTSIINGKVEKMYTTDMYKQMEHDLELVNIDEKPKIKNIEYNI